MDQYILKIQQLADQELATEQVELMEEATSYLNDGDLSRASKSSYLFRLASVPIDIPLLESQIDTQEFLLGKAYEYTGTRFLSTGQFLDAKESFTKAVELLTNYGKDYSAYKLLGHVSGSMEEFDNCINYYNKAISSAEKYFGNEHKDKNYYMFALHTNINSAYMKTFNFRKARYHTNRAIEYANSSNEPGTIVSSNVLLAQLELFTGGPEVALEILDKIKVDISDDHPMAMAYYNFRATAYVLQESYEEALPNYEKSASYFLDGPNPNKFLNQMGVAECKLNLGQHRAAISMLTEGINFYNQQSGRFTNALAESYETRAEAYLKQGNISQAREDIDRALSLDGESEMSKISYVSNLTTIYSKLYEDTKNDIYIDSIYISIAQNDSVISSVREKHRHYEDFLGVNEYVHDTYASNLEQLGKLQEERPDKIKFDLVFKYFEGLKSFSLKEILKTDDAVLIGNVPEDVLDEERKIKLRLSNIQKEIYSSEQSSLPTAVDSLDKILELERVNYYAFLNQLELDHPNYYRFQYEDKEYDLNSLQNLLSENEAVIEYFLDKDHIYILVVDQENIRFKSISKPNDWEAQLDKFRQTSSDVNYVSNQSNQEVLFKEFTSSSSYLYELLLADVLNGFDSSIVDLVIIPDNELNIIPFGILVKPSQIQFEGYKDLDYVIKDFTLSYEQTATDIIEQVSQSRNSTSTSYVGFAPRYGEEADKELVLQGDKKSDLPMARASVNAISDLLDGKAYSEETSISSFFEEGMNADVLHLAMHGIVNQKDPQFSHLLFSDDEENKLYATDIYNLKLNNQLAMLSACNTGTGKIIDGDGVQNLAKAFRFAGVESTIMSLWSVPDEQTADINLKFFNNLKTGQKIDAALKNAKLSYLSSAPKFGSHPFFWAGFIPSGNTNEVITFRDSNPISITSIITSLLIGSVGAILVFVILKRINLKQED